MKVIFLENARNDLKWFKRYYVAAFPEGRTNADKRYLSTLKNLQQNPLIGHSSQALKGAREFHISRTPFSFLYRVTKDHIEVLRVVDNRSNWDQKILDDENEA